MNKFGWIVKAKVIVLMVVGLTATGVSVSSAQDGWRKADALFQAMDLTEGRWVADVGSREGYYTVRMAPRVGDTGHIFAVDINADALEDLHENLQERGIENVTPVYSIPESPMLPARALDAVLVRNAYHEFTDYMDMLRQIYRSLKPGGRLILADPISPEMQDASRDAQTDDHELALKFAREELRNAGFEIIEIDEEFSEVRRGRRYWMMIAVRPAD